MTKLSPSAQAVLAAYEQSNDCYREEWGQLAAALRAAVDQVVPEFREHHPATFDEKHRKVSAFDVRNQLLAIANELEKAN